MMKTTGGLSALQAHLHECVECALAVEGLVQRARRAGYRQGGATGMERRSIIAAIAVLSLAVVAFLVANLTPWHWQPDRDISRVYAESSLAVVNLRVDSTGTAGSGVVFDRRGYVLTSYHVIAEARDDQDLMVQLLGLNEVSARTIGVDSATDLAVLQVDVSPGRLTVASFGDSDTVRVGDRAMAIGSPFGLAYSLTVGYISAVGRRLLSDDPTAPDVEQVLQTDAALNPGNSGGPLLNNRGQVIGINTRIQSPSGGSVGLGFAVPSNTAIRVARGLVMQDVQHRAPQDPTATLSVPRWPKGGNAPSTVGY